MAKKYAIAMIIIYVILAEILGDAAFFPFFLAFGVLALMVISTGAVFLVEHLHKKERVSHVGLKRTTITLLVIVLLAILVPWIGYLILTAGPCEPPKCIPGPETAPRSRSQQQSTQEKNYYNTTYSYSLTIPANHRAITNHDSDTSGLQIAEADDLTVDIVSDESFRSDPEPTATFSIIADLAIKEGGEYVPRNRNEAVELIRSRVFDASSNPDSQLNELTVKDYSGYQDSRDGITSYYIPYRKTDNTHSVFVIEFKDSVGQKIFESFQFTKPLSV